MESPWFKRLWFGRFWVKKFWSEKFLVQMKISGPKIIFGSKKAFVSKKAFGSKKFLDSKIILAQKSIWVKKVFGLKKVFGSKKILIPKNSESQKFWVQKICVKKIRVKLSSSLDWALLQLNQVCQILCGRFVFQKICCINLVWKI